MSALRFAVTSVIGSLVGVVVACGQASDGGDTVDGGANASPSLGIAIPDGAPSAYGTGVERISPDAACAAASSQATLSVLDVYIMLDASGSMSDKTSTGKTKWAAITAALAAFANDPASAGIRVGLDFFPQTNPSVPATCSADAQCGAYGPCMNKACTLTAPSSGVIMPCNSDKDCTGTACAVVGICDKNESYLCTNVGGSCGGALGNCVASSGATCDQLDSCMSEDYAKPVVELSELPGNGAALLSAMGARAPHGQTPTSAALQGAVTHALSVQAANPKHKQVIVLATDGIPTKCYPLDGDGVGAIAQTALNDGIQTFVIGILGANDKSAEPTIAKIAQAGGTSEITIDTSSQDVTAAFLDFLNTVRGKTLPCDFSLPLPEGGAVDYGQINVDVTVGSALSTVGNVDNAGACDATRGGWYYDDAMHPSKIDLCPKTCAAVKADSNARVDVLLGCATEHELR